MIGTIATTGTTADNCRQRCTAALVLRSSQSLCLKPHRVAFFLSIDVTGDYPRGVTSSHCHGDHPSLAVFWADVLLVFAIIPALAPFYTTSSLRLPLLPPWRRPCSSQARTSCILHFRGRLPRAPLLRPYHPLRPLLPFLNCPNLRVPQRSPRPFMMSALTPHHPRPSSTTCGGRPSCHSYRRGRTISPSRVAHRFIPCSP